MTSGEGTTYKLRLSTKASKYLLSLNRSTASRLLDRMEGLKTDPYRMRGVKSLTGQLAGFHRLRVGDYRIVYEIDNQHRIIMILVIDTRGSIYK